MEIHEVINDQIKNSRVDTGLISDGYHTFDELYESRNVLWVALCKELDAAGKATIWRSRRNADGEEWKGWFLLGANLIPGNQMSFHLPIEFWDACDFALSFTSAPAFDGHTTPDVLRRVAAL